MESYCIQCGRPVFDTVQLCFDCTNNPPQPNFPSPGPDYARPSTAQQAQPFDRPPVAAPVGNRNAGFAMQNASQCLFCGGAGGVFAKSNISTGGFVYMGVMFLFTFFTFLIFFPCAIIPFGLIFLGLLFRDKHFACINCGKRVS